MLLINKRIREDPRKVCRNKGHGKGGKKCVRAGDKGRGVVTRAAVLAEEGNNNHQIECVSTRNVA